MTTPSTEYRTIPLTQGQETIVDAADYDLFSRFRWCALWCPDRQSFCAARNVRRMIGKGYTTSYLHREILGLQRGDYRTADHRNHDTLDNRRKNLRIATNSQQQQNKRTQKNNLLGIKGVSCRKGRFIARIMVNGKALHLGSRRTAEEAHLLYCEFAKQFHGQFSCLD